MVGHVRALLEAMAANPRQTLGELSLLNASERRELLIAWSATTADPPSQSPMHALFEAQAAHAPGAVAVRSGGHALSYGELERLANQLAHALRKRGVGPGVLVGICMRRGHGMVVALLGILKAGGAYVPLDPDYPPERLAFMLEDCGAKLLLTEESLARTLSPLPPACEVMLLDREAEALAIEPWESPRAKMDPSDPAYAIFTSGSTGKPKAALLSHAGLANLAASEFRLYGVGPESRVLQFSSLSFDTSLSEIAMALCSGATLYVEDRQTLMPGPDLEDYVAREEITVLSLTPSALAVLDPAAVPSVSLVVVGGEACRIELAARWAGRCRFFNAYGPTEATITATCVEYRDGAAPPNIGRALPNVRVYVLDDHGNLCPVGVPGELCIGGVGVALGYINRPQLTAERFVRDPFSAAAGARMYRTGDVARWRDDGALEHLGRLDFQVKVRGFRIELGEIEANIAAQPEVRESTVIAREDIAGDPRLVAYLVPRDGQLDVTQLQEQLLLRLPHYMVPSAFVVLQALPRLPNGKVDR
jgi:amino acid adenylation domain-containing protein